MKELLIAFMLLHYVYTYFIQLMICLGMTVTFIVGTLVTWRTLVLTGKS